MSECKHEAAKPGAKQDGTIYLYCPNCSLSISEAQLEVVWSYLEKIGEMGKAEELEGIKPRAARIEYGDTVRYMDGDMEITGEVVGVNKDDPYNPRFVVETDWGALRYPQADEVVKVGGG